MRTAQKYSLLNRTLLVYHLTPFLWLFQQLFRSLARCRWPKLSRSCQAEPGPESPRKAATSSRSWSGQEGDQEERRVLAEKLKIVWKPCSAFWLLYIDVFVLGYTNWTNCFQFNDESGCRKLKEVQTVNDFVIRTAVLFILPKRKKENVGIMI